MAKLINKTKRDITLPTWHVVPAGGELITTNQVLRCADNVRQIGTLVSTKALEAKYDEPAKEASTDIKTSATAATPASDDPAKLPRKA